MKGLVKKISFVLIIIAIAIIAIFNQQTIKTIGINQITDPEILAEMTYAQLKEKDKKVSGTDNILFSAFFLRDLDKDGYAEKIKGTCKSINDTDMLYIDFNVLGAGRFVNGNISLKLANCEWETVLVADNVVQDNRKGKVANIRLNNDLLGGSQKLFWGSISPKIDNNINNYHGINQIILTGTYIDEDQNSIPIRKTVYLPVDWYGTTGTKVNKYKTIQRNNLETLIQDDLVKVQFVATVSESKQELILQKQEVEIDIPELNGYKATNAYAKDDKYTSTFNSNTQKLKVTNASTVDDTGKIQKSIARNNEYELVLVYPIEAYQANEDSNLSIDIKVNGKNYGYNNNYSANYFTNPEISSDSNVITVIYEQPTVEEENETPISYIIEPYTPRNVWSINTTIGEYVYSPILGTGMRVSKDHIIDKYNGNDYENFDNSYRVAWNITLYYSDGIGTMIFEEPKLEDETSKKDNFIKSSNERISTRDYETVTKIQFKDIYKILGKDGWIKIYDADTGVLQETLTYEQWGNAYPLNVKSIRVETSAPTNSGSFKIYQTKELDAEKIVQDFTKEEFQSFRYMQTYLKGVINAMPDATFKNGNTTETKTCTGQARYDEAVSIAKISVSPTTISNQQTENVNIYLHTISSNEFEKKWINGQFLVELPPDIISVGINSVTATLGSEPLNYSLIKQDDRYLIKIIMNNDVEESHDITINADITANPTKPSQSEEITLYAYNENCNNYSDFVLDKYDANVNGSTTDNIGHATTTLTTGAPSQLLTTEYVTNYDDNNSVAIAPNVAEINKESGENTATINIGVLNNYIGTVSEVQILGRTPYQGNKYVLLEQSLKSTYTAELTGPINIPEELQGEITVYYSTNGEATRDLEDPDNEWTTTVTDYSLIRSYLIDFGDYNYTQMSNDVFTYEVRVPANLGYESAAFSTHCIYYTLDTQAGKIYQQTEPNRVGIQIVGKYNMQITKNKLGNENTKVEGAMYRLVGLDVNGREISQVETTDQNGNLTFRDIYIGREYTLEEILSPKDYVLNEEKIKFVTNLDGLGNLSVTTLEGSFKEQPEFVINNNVILVKAKVEDDTKYTITLNKKDENNQIIEGVLFSFGNENNVKVYSTDNTGKIVFRGLDIGKEYKLKEVKAKGYYTDEDYRTFKMERNQNNELVMISNDPELSNAIISYPDQVVQTQVEINIVNEEIPTYKLQIMKVNEIKGNEEEIPLAGAHFRFESTDDNEQEEYVTDENGIIGIDGLYTYIEGKSITGKYIIHELKAPDGYTNNVERISFRVEKKQDDSLEIKIDNVNLLTTLKEVIIEDNIVKIKIQDKPLFKLTKIDKETGLPLANAEFIIYRMRDDVIEYAKDPNGYYIGELNAEGDYIVKTNELGEIILPLPNGIYCAAEVKYPEGYKEMGTKEYFRVGTIENEDQIIEDVSDETGESSETSNAENLEVVEINYIEDLVDLSNEVNEGINYENTVIKLKRGLDFNNSEHYRDATSLDYGDLNGDEVISTIKDEVTLENSVGFKPIGKDKENAFKGIFDGQNYKIENLYQNNSYEYTGLFGCVSGGTIKDLGVSASIKNKGNVSDIQSYYSGIIAGTIDENSQIENCYTEGSVENYATGRNSNYTHAGGIVGDSRGKIINCYNSGTIRTSTSNYGKRNTSWSGGIASRSTGNIVNCYNLGEIRSGATGSSGSNSSISGGIAACTEGIIRNCYNKGTISGSVSSSGYSRVGGIAGSLNTNGKILNCYNTNSASASGQASSNTGSYAGGIVGTADNNTIVSYCYSTGNVSAKSRAGAIIGESNGVCNNSVYLDSITTSDSNLEGYAETSSYMKSDAMVKYMGERNWSKDIENSNDGYPILKPYIEMTDEDKIKEINYIEDLVDLEKDINTGEDYSNITIKLNRTLNFENEESYRDYSSTSYGDINGNGTLESIINELISEKGFIPIGISNNTAYCGCFDGQGYAIQNLYENIAGITGNYAGLFGHVEKGEIKNLGITGTINISGRLRNVDAGGIAGYTGKEVIVSNCYSIVNIDAILNDPTATSTHLYYGTLNAGGIVGKTDGLVRDSYNMGTFNFSTNTINGFGYIGGIAGRVSSTGKVSNCYNEGMDGISGSAYIGGIVGTSDGIITDCYNTTNFELEDAHEYTGGIVGTSTGIVNKCYNNGNIICENSWMGIGGIVGYNAGSVSNTYNTGAIQSDYAYSSLGGIVGYSAYEGTVKNSYNTGNIIGGETEGSENSDPGAVDAITGNGINITNSYYLNSITIEGTTIYNNENEPVSDSDMRTKDFYGKLNKDLAWYYIEGEYPILLNDSLLNALEPNVEIIVDNEIKKFKITTDILEEDGVKGGTISGEDEDPYELVTYNQNSTKSIEIIPEDDYVISKITINGESIEYVPDENRAYTIPENYFKNVQEDKHIVVTFSSVDKSIKIKKVDKEGNPLDGATFEAESTSAPQLARIVNTGEVITSVDLNQEITNVLGNLENNGMEYAEENKMQPVENVLGPLNSNSTYGFDLNSDNQYVSNNQGVSSSTANSYFTIDLTEKTGNYVAVVNANVSSESGFDYGYATITTSNSSTPLYSSTSGRFIYISGTSTTVTTPTDYTSTVLTGGNVYYLYLGYRKDGSGNKGSDTFTVNSINIYETHSVKYGFENQEGALVSNNNGKHNTTANSMIPIDLRELNDSYYVAVNANVSSASGDYGYATISTSTTAPAYNSASGRFIYINGTSTTVTTPTDYYSSLLTGGQLYYLHLGYYKNASSSLGDDCFTVNDIKVYKAKTKQLGFEEDDGEYTPNNLENPGKTATSYIKLDLSEYPGEYKIKVNAEIDSRLGYDYGYMFVTNNTDTPYRYDETGRVFSISGLVSAKDYEITIEGGQIYYIHLGYERSSSTYVTPVEDEYFRINSIEVSGKDRYIATTNAEGEAIISVKNFGEYIIKETKAPEHYLLSEEEQVVNITYGNPIQEVQFENERAGEVIVHHYLMGTTEKVAKDDVLEGKIGETYEARPHVDLDKLKLHMDEATRYEDFKGLFTEENKEIIFYYEADKIKLTIHHYKNGTEDAIVDDEVIETESDIAFEGELQYNVTTQGSYELKENNNYKQLSKKLDFVSVSSELDYDLTIDDTLEYTQDAEVTYYYDVTENSYTVNYFYNNVKDENATEVLTGIFKEYSEYPDKCIDGYMFDKAKALDEEGNETDLPLIIKENSEYNVINVYYESIDYIVHYKELGTDNNVAEDKIGKGHTIGEIIQEEAIEVEGYDKVAPTEISIEVIAGTNEVTFYYTKRTDLSYTVNYLEKDTNNVLHTAKTEPNQTFEQVITSVDEVITIYGYDYDSADKDSLTIGVNVSENIINLYYTKKDTSVIAHYYIEGTTNKVPSNVEGEVVEDVTIEGKVNDTYTTESAENISSIYELVATPENATGTMTVESIDVYYYYKLKNYDYTVEYYYDNVIDDTKTDTLSETYGKQITEYADKVITGYKLDKTENLPLTISDNTSNNVIKVYYTKRTDLSYTVNYLEKNTNNVLHTAKTEPNQTFGDEIISADEIIAIYGYDYDSADKDSLTIGAEASENVINLYYTRAAASVLVHYYIENTTTRVPSTTDGEEVADATLNGLVGDTYTTTQASNVSNKYELVSATPAGYTGEYTEDDITVIYYYRLKDTSVTAHYYIEGTNNKVPSNVEGEVVEDATIEGKVDDTYTTNPAGNVSSIYELVATPENATGTMTVESIDVYYYYKLKNYDYTVEYYYDNVIDNEKTDTLSETYGKQITEYTDKVITGYKFDKTENLPLTISDNTSNNVIKVYYIKRTDLSYTVNYLEKNTNNVLHTAKTEPNKTFGDVIRALDEVIVIYGYDYDSADKDSLTIGTEASENVINLYYTKKNAKVTAKYMLENTTTEIANPVEHTGKVGETYTTHPSEDIESKYELISATPEGYTGTYTEDDITVIYYYRLKDTQVIVHHYIQNNDGTLTTTKVPSNVDGKVVEDVVISGQVDDGYTTSAATNLHNSYELVITPEKATGIMTEDQIEIAYYYALKDAKAVARYVDLYAQLVKPDDTDEIAERQTKTGKVGDAYTTDQKTIEGYTFIRDTNNTSGTLTVEDIDVVYYYAPNTYVKVRYLEKGTNEVLVPEKTINGFAGKDYATDEETIENYTLVEVAGTANGTMTVNPITVTYYYSQNTKARVEYIDKADGRVMDSIEKTGLVGDEFATEAKEFENYILVESPNVTTVNMTKDVITLKYYYAYANASLIVRHINVITGAVIESSIENGKVEGETYETTAKDIEGYDLVGEYNGHDYTPQNARGTYTKETITVDYYYIRKTSVTAKYIDKATGETLTKDVVINGHENDPYQTNEKTISGYALDSVDGDKTGTMTITTDSEGNVVTNKEVVYYYKKASTVKVNHIDISTDEVLIAEIKNGYEGDNYSTTAKSIEGYDLVETRLPENKDGIFTRDEQTVNYYYIPRLTVKVIYQAEDGTELDQYHIEGHEGDEYTTVEKKFKGYEIAEVPNNAEGTMVVTKDENGNRNTEIIVIYKYKKLIPKDVIEKYIDINTDETVKEVIHKGELGEVYSIKPKTIPGYTLLTEDENGNSLLPTNTTGKYTTEKGEVVFYVIKNASVRVQHINLITGEKMADDVIIEGYEGRGYTTEALTFEGYELTGIPENARGKMKVTIDENGNKVSEIVVKYYYAEKLDGRLPKTNESNTKQAILIAIPFVVLINLCLCAKTFEKSKKGKDKEMRKNKKEAKAEESDK